MKILFFAPFSAIWKHAVLENQLANLIKETNQEVEIFWVNCDSTFPGYCTAREYLQGKIDKQNDNSCKVCKTNDKIVKMHSRFNYISISEFITADDRKEADCFANANQYLNPLEIYHDNLEFGRIACYETLIKFKKSNLDFDLEEQPYFFEALRNCYLTYLAAQRINLKLEPHISISTNPQYGIPGIFQELSMRMGIKTFYIAGSSSLPEMYSAIKIWNWNKYKSDPYLDNIIQIESESPENDFTRARKHFETLSRAESYWVYSKASSGCNPYDSFKIDRHKKILLAVMNSDDEAFASWIRGMSPETRWIGQVFRDQNEWIRFLIHFVSQRQDIHLIIRPHPRNFPNNRESRISKSTKNYLSWSIQVPQNVSIDLPENEFSIYDYFPHIIGITTGWSSVALQAIYFGVPAVTYDKNLPRYPSNLHITGDSVLEYENNLQQLIQGSNVVDKTAVIKWFAQKQISPTIRVGGEAINRQFLGKPILSRIAHNIHPRLRKHLDLIAPVNKVDKNKVIKIFGS